MRRRYYNIFFNTHTISGIVISVALYVIFFAGAFALFKGEIQLWQEGEAISHTKRSEIDFDNIFLELDKKYGLTGRDLQINFQEKEDAIYVYMDASRDSLASEEGKKSNYWHINIHSAETKSYEAQYSLGEFLFRLHFFSQIPQIGMYLAGFVSLFFLFAIVTGVIVHWKKIIPNFYTFNPAAILKRVWADAHTALGVIGLPFQFMFALTGAYFGLSILVLIPANFLYQNNQKKLMEDLRPALKVYEWRGESRQKPLNFNDFAQKAATYWKDFNLTRAFVRNYGGKNMKYVLIGELTDKNRFVGTGRLVFDAYSGKIEAQKDPNKLNYIEDIQRFLGRLHFGDFGGISTKIIYFILAIITCFVIITGVLIWVEARNKKSNTPKQRRYTTKIGHIYLAICLSMLPVTALSFLFVKCTEGLFIDKKTSIYYFYFISWLVFTIFFRFKRDNYYTNKVTLLLGSIFGFLIPVANGIISGNWFWLTYKNQQFEIFLVDILWMLIASVALIFYLKIKENIKTQSIADKNKTGYTNRKPLNGRETLSKQAKTKVKKTAF